MSNLYLIHELYKCGKENRESYGKLKHAQRLQLSSNKEMLIEFLVVNPTKLEE